MARSGLFDPKTVGHCDYLTATLWIYSYACCQTSRKGDFWRWGTSISKKLFSIPKSHRNWMLGHPEWFSNHFPVSIFLFSFFTKKWQLYSLFRTLTFSRKFMDPPFGMKTESIREPKVGVGINRFYLVGIWIGIDSAWPCSILESESELAPVFWIGIGIDSQMESSTSMSPTEN